MEIEILETERLLLRKLTLETYDHVFNNYQEEEIKFFCCKNENDLAEERRKFKQGCPCTESLFLFSS